MEQLYGKTSLLDSMIDGKEYESIVSIRNNVDPLNDLRIVIDEIQSIRKRKCICYLTNMTNLFISSRSPISIDGSDELPFLEMINAVDEDEEEVDLILVTPGGSIENVITLNRFLRNRFKIVNFILPYKAMSAGTIFCASGDEIVMSKNASIGPIDPQIPSKDGRFVPAQSIQTLIESIKEKGEKALEKGEKIDWTDIQILKNLDPKELGNAIISSELSINTVESYLLNYKFKNWAVHSDSGKTVTEKEKKDKANKIAKMLCNQKIWKTHAHPIDRETAVEKCELKITYDEKIGLDRSLRRFWAIATYIFENSNIYKMFVSESYSFIRNINVK